MAEVSAFLDSGAIAVLPRVTLRRHTHVVYHIVALCKAILIWYLRAASPRPSAKHHLNIEKNEILTRYVFIEN